jgi:hypothetical protein
MAAIKFFPTKDSTIYTEFPTMNAGIGEILDLTKYQSFFFPTYSATSRILFKFPTDDIVDFLNNNVINSFQANLRMFVADANSLPLSFSLSAFAVSESWDMGTGRPANIPITTNGVSWEFRTADATAWNVTNLSPQVTSSFFSGNPGGGNWYTPTKCDEQFDNSTDLDTSIDVTIIIDSIRNQSIIDQGIIVMNDPDVEFDPNYSYTLNYFSRDTNTIYAPYLELLWDDSVYTIPVSVSISPISTRNMVVSLGNNRGTYFAGAIERFNVNVREQFPTRAFVTSSIFTQPKFLPTSSFYSIRDLDTDLVIVDFDDNYTKISLDQDGNFFNVHMSGFEPERYYKFLFKVEMSGSVQIFDSNYIFKVSKE